MADARENCGGCRFFRARKALPNKEAVTAAVPAGIDMSVGNCRRFPAEVQKQASDWCGEWIEKLGRRKP